MSEVDMKKFFEDVLKLPYKSNSQDNPKHENQVEELLIKHRLKYVPQPNSKQNSPDFHVYYNGAVISLECKSSQETFPTYNGGLPKKRVIYIFSSAKYNETTIYFAEDVVSDVDREWLDETVVRLNEILREQQQIKPDDKFNRGFDFYIRNMYTQSGRGKKDYFKHEDRKRCEQNVLNTAW